MTGKLAERPDTRSGRGENKQRKKEGTSESASVPLIDSFRMSGNTV